MPNAILTPQMITREALRVLYQELNFVKNTTREYDSRFAVTGAKIGTTLNIRKPAKYTVSSGAPLSPQDFTETYVPLAVTNQNHVDVTFTSAELTLQLDDFSDRVLKPAMAALANSIESQVLTQLVPTVFNQVGSAVAPFNSMRLAGLAKKKLDDQLTPSDGDRCMFLNTDSEVEIIDATKGLFQSSSQIKDQYEKGQMGLATGFTWYQNTLLPTQTPGAYSGSPVINAAGQTGSNITSSGWPNTTTVLKKGDIITLPGCFMVHPQTKITLGNLQQFVVTADVLSNGSGVATIPVYPAVVTSGPFQTVSAAPTNGQAILLTNSVAASTPYGVNLAMHKNAFAFATADLEDVSQYGAWGARENFEGISMRVARQYAIGTDTVPCRLDVLWGATALYPELACRVANVPMS